MVEGITWSTEQLLRGGKDGLNKSAGHFSVLPHEVNRGQASLYLAGPLWFWFPGNEVHSLYCPEVHGGWVGVPQPWEWFPRIARLCSIVGCVGLLIISLSL